MLELCFKLTKVIRRNVFSFFFFFLKDFRLSARILESRSRVFRRPGPWDVILCRLMYRLATFCKTVVCSRLRESCTIGQEIIS